MGSGVWTNLKKLFKCAMLILCVCKKLIGTCIKLLSVIRSGLVTFFINNGNERSCGVATLVKNNIVDNVRSIFNDSKGRVIQVEFTYSDVKYNIINVYAPINEVERKALFFKFNSKDKRKYYYCWGFQCKAKQAGCVRHSPV